MKSTVTLRAAKALGVAAALLVSVAAPAGGFDQMKKLYFAATKPGAWSKYEQKTTDAKGKVTLSTITLSRLETEGAKAWIEIRTEPQEQGKKNKPSTVKYLMKEDFNLEKNALAYLDFVDRVVMQTDGSEAQEMPMETFRTMGASLVGNIDYGSNITAKGSETVDGKSTDRFSVSGTYDVKVMFIRVKGSYETDIWLSDEVPFGRVKESSLNKNEKGELIARTEWRLLESGTGAKSRITGPVKKVEIPPMPGFGQ